MSKRRHPGREQDRQAEDRVERQPAGRARAGEDEQGHLRSRVEPDARTGTRAGTSATASAPPGSPARRGGSGIRAHRADARAPARRTPPCRIRRKMRTIPTRMIRFRIPISERNVPETTGPIRPVVRCSVESSFSTAPLRPRMPNTTRIPSRKTIVECPSEKKNPTLSGRWPSFISLRVVLSIAPMWSASKACLMPERVRRDADAEPEGAVRAEAVVVRQHERDEQEEADRVQAGDRGDEQPCAPPFGRRQRP